MHLDQPVLKHPVNRSRTSLNPSLIEQISRDKSLLSLVYLTFQLIISSFRAANYDTNPRNPPGVALSSGEGVGLSQARGCLASGTGKGKMHLNHDPLTQALLQDTGPAGMLPVGRLTLPFIHIVKHAKEPGHIPCF